MAKPRYTLSEISGVQASYEANPGGSTGVGQVAFALSAAGGQILLGCCYQGNCLIPWGICCTFAPNQSSACTNQNCVKPGFSLGASSSTYLALGSVNGCGATLFRRIR